MPWPVLLLAFAATPCQAATTTLAGASLRPVQASECWLRLTRERSRELWRSYLTFQDRTAPLLPEPGAMDPGAVDPGGPGFPLLPP